MGLSWRYDIGSKMHTVAGLAARLAGEHLRERAVARTPVETGVLRASAKVTTDGTTAAVSYNTPYAARQHEEVGWQHNDGEAKFLENAATAEAETLKQIVADTIREGLQ